MAARKQSEKRNGFDAIVRKLNSDQSEENWESFASALKKSGIRYYNVVFPSGLDGEADLTKSHITLYDKNYAEKHKIPVLCRHGKKIEGATRYLIGLEINRKVL